MLFGGGEKFCRQVEEPDGAAGVFHIQADRFLGDRKKHEAGTMCKIKLRPGNEKGFAAFSSKQNDFVRRAGNIMAKNLPQAGLRSGVVLARLGMRYALIAC